MERRVIAGASSGSALWLAPWAALCLAAAAPRPPPARAGRVTDTAFGQTIADPYHWMESPSAEFDGWAGAQDRAARAALAGIPGRAALRRHMADIAGAMTVVSAVVPVGHRLFFRRRDPGQTLAKLVVRDADTGRDRVLLDPNTIRLAGRPIAIGLFPPSQDGRYVAVGVTTGPAAATPPATAKTMVPGPPSQNPAARPPGAGEVLVILDADTGHRLPDTIGRARIAALSWLPDGASFFYDRLPPAGGNAGTVFLHHLGADPARDPAVFGAGVAGLTIPPGAVVAVAAIIGTRFALGIQNDGVAAEIALYVSPIPISGAFYHWRRIAGPQDGITDVAAGRDTLFFRSHANAPRYQVLAVPLDRPDLAAARIVVPQGEGVLTNIAVAADALYAARRKGAASTVLRVGEDDRPSPISLPRTGSIAAPGEGAGGLTADPRVPGAIVGIASWVAAPEYFRIGEPGTPATPLGLSPPPPDTDQYRITETDVPANDGRTRLPLSIIERRDTPHDNHRPVLVEGYGAFGVSDEPDPRFVPVVRGWVDAGGVMAIAHVRGGGELGEAWHVAGQKITKQNSIHDFIDCAWWMTELGYASPDTLAATGTGAGGITVAGAILQLPSLFRAALIRDGSTNPLRHALDAAGAREFGSTAIQAEFTALLAMDPTQHVKPGTSYPAVLLTGGGQDRHAPLWESAKLAARLQAAGARAKGPALLLVNDAVSAGQTPLPGQARPNATRADAAPAYAAPPYEAPPYEDWADGFAFLLWQMGVAGYQPAR